jgi:hypothetical protein
MLMRLAEDHRTRERKIVVPPMKQESLWFKLCLGEPSHLQRDDPDDDDQTILPSHEDEETEEGEADDDDQTPSSDSSDLISQKQNLLKEFSLHSKKSLSSADASVPPRPLSADASDENPIKYSIGVVPTTSLMLQFDQVLTQKLLGYHLKWLTKRFTRLRSLYVYEVRLDRESVPPPPLPFYRLLTSYSDRKDTSLSSEGDLFLQWRCAINLHCKWIYSLLVRLEKPLYQDVAADLREIYRTASSARWEFEEFVTKVLQSPDLPPREDMATRTRGQGKKELSDHPSSGPRSSHSKGVVRFSEVFDEDDGRREICHDSNQALRVGGVPVRLEDLSSLSEELSWRAEEYLASLNTLIVICGRYFGQEEDEEGGSGEMSGTWSEEDCGSYEEDGDGEEADEEEEEEVI